MNCIKEEHLERPSSHKLVRCREFLLCVLISVGCLSCGSRPAPPVIDPPIIPSQSDAKLARAASLAGDLEAIDVMIGWSLHRLELDEWNENETNSFWEGMHVKFAQKKGIETYYSPDSGIYKGRVARECIRP